MKPWYWIYPRNDHDAEVGSLTGKRCHTAKAVQSGRIRTSTLGDTTYFHCPDCPAAYYTAEAAIGCCGAVRAQKRYLRYLASQRKHTHYSITLDTAAI